MTNLGDWGSTLGDWGATLGGDGSVALAADDGHIIIEAQDESDLTVIEVPILEADDGLVLIETLGESELTFAAAAYLAAVAGDDSRAGAVIVDGAPSMLTVTPFAVPPPAGVTVSNLKRVSPTMPTPTLGSYGRPV